MNDVSLKEYLEALIRGVDERATLRAAHIEEAIRLAKDGLDLRLEGMNDIRAQLNMQARTFATIVAHEALKEKVEELRRDDASSVGRRAVLAPLATQLLYIAGAVLAGYLLHMVIH